MDKPAIRSIDAIFTRENNECTRLSVACETDQLYIIRGVCSRVRHDDFEVQELIEHHAQPSRQDVQKLFDALEEAHLECWYHHYLYHLRSCSWLGYSTKCQWSLRVTFEDDSSSRWEGTGDSPATIDAVYKACTQAGMPPLHLGYRNSFSSLDDRGRDPYELALLRLENYCDLLADALGKRNRNVEDATEEEYQTLVREMLEDVRLFLREYNVSPLSVDLPEGWGSEPTVAKLCERDVSHAGKVQVFALFASLAKQDDPEEAIRCVIESGTYRSWFRRLREIPHEERREQLRQEEIKREEKRHEIDAIIERRIEQNETFTSIELARETDTSASMANGRIRRFVKQGRIATVGDGIPRTYRAA